MCQVVVIDDDTQVRRQLTQLISNKGYSVKNAPNGKIGLEIVKNKKPVLVITDIIMPEEDGLEVLSKIRVRFPNITTIAISGGSGRLNNFPLLELATKIGADYIFEKPLDDEQIVSVITQILN